MWELANLGTLEKSALDSDTGNELGSKKVLPWWTPLATAGALGLGTYAFARHPAAGPRGSGLAKIRQLANGNMLYGTGEMAKREGLPLLERLKLHFTEGPVINTSERGWSKNLPKGKQQAIWDWDYPGVKGKTFNPALGAVSNKQQHINSQLASNLEDRWTEYQLLNKYVPGSQGRTKTINDILKQYRLKLRPGYMSSDLKRLQNALKQEFPTGYLAKTRGEGTVDVNVNSTGNFPFGDENWVKLWKDWKHLRPKYMRDLAKEKYDLSNVAFKYRDRKGYSGRVLEEMLANNAVLQETLPLAGEHRVHVIGGKALPYFTHPRYPGDTWWDTAKEFWKGRQAANWLQKEVLDKLPKQYRDMSYAADVARLENGQHSVIELNTGGSSGYLDYPFVPNLLHRAVTGRWTKPVAGAFAGGAGVLGAGAGAGALALSPRTSTRIPQTPALPEEDEAPISLANYR